MNQTVLEKTTKHAGVGEDIGLDEGLRLVRAFREAYPEATPGYYIGRNIIEKILAQPGVVGINFRKCLSENGEEHLVYTGVDEKGEDILAYPVINTSGEMDTEDGIVADRVILDWDIFFPPKPKDPAPPTTPPSQS